MKTENELIAEFVGFEIIQAEKSFPLYLNPHTNSWVTKNDLRFNSSWDWLMPVIERIDSLMPPIKMPQDLNALKEGNHGSEKFMDVIAVPLNTPITEVYKSVVEFIKWYNTQKS